MHGVPTCGCRRLTNQPVTIKTVEKTVNQRGDKHKARRVGREGEGQGLVPLLLILPCMVEVRRSLSFKWQAVPCTIQNTLFTPLQNTEHYSPHCRIQNTIYPTAEYRTLYSPHCTIQNTLFNPLQNTEHDSPQWPIENTLFTPLHNTGHFIHPTAQYRTLFTPKQNTEHFIHPTAQYRTLFTPLHNTEHFIHPKAEYRTLYSPHCRIQNTFSHPTAEYRTPYSWHYSVRNERQWEWLGLDVRQVFEGWQPMCGKEAGGGVWGNLGSPTCLLGWLCWGRVQDIQKSKWASLEDPCFQRTCSNTLPAISAVPH